MENLIEQLPTPIILMGEFDAHSKMWGCNDTNLTGKIIESISESPELCILNEKNSHLHSSRHRNNISNLFNPMLSLNFPGRSMGVHDDQCGSDHSPIFLKSKNLTPEETNSKWQIHKADWIK